MLIEFTFGNFRSFKDLTTLSMVAARISSKYDELDKENVQFIEPKLSLLKSKAIYGQNASGKSNIVKALVTFLRIVRYSVKREEVISKLVEPFKLNEKGLKEPTFFQIIFRVVNENNEATIYRYGFEIQDSKVLTEWLFAKTGREEVPYFTREDMVVQVKRSFKEAKKYEGLLLNKDSEIFRNNSLFLTAVAAMGSTSVKSIINAIGNITVVSGLNDPRIKEVLKDMLKDKVTKDTILSLARTADFDIENIEPISSNNEEEDSDEDMPDELKILFQTGKLKKMPSFMTQRAVFGNSGAKIDSITSTFEEWESEGTKKFLYLSPFLLTTLNEGNTLVIDEFDARLHPNLTKKIVQIFNSIKTNPKGAQLIFVTHDSNLLNANFLRRDQICFVDKNKLGVSSLRTLVEFKGVRNDASFEKSYLNGEYGAVPFLNRFEQNFTN
jgi:uncharacterized protein